MSTSLKKSTAKIWVVIKNKKSSSKSKNPVLEPTPQTLQCKSTTQRTSLTTTSHPASARPTTARPTVDSASKPKAPKACRPCVTIPTTDHGRPRSHSRPIGNSLPTTTEITQAICHGMASLEASSGIW